MKYLPILLLASTLMAQTDGPAQLPIAIPSTNFISANTPKIVGPTDNLQTAINSAQCGDVLNVDPANVYTGGLTFPALACDSQHWITVQSAAPIFYDVNGIVAKGQQLPKIILPISNSFVRLGSFVALKGFEITTLSNRPVVYTLVYTSGAHDVILDSDYIHGTPTDETQRGLSLSNSTNVAVINSRFEDFHCESVVGSCGDSQAINGGTSNSNEGTFLIQNDYLEASGENVIFGGGSATVVPCDITIRYNFFNKPASWNPADPSYVAPPKGYPWTVKNLLEFKNACRVLVERNKFSGSWGGFSQLGWAWLITPKNQAGALGSNLCPICADHDITLRYNDVTRTGAWFQMGFGPSDNGGWPVEADRYSIHGNNVIGQNYAYCYRCGHYLIQISGGANAANGQVLNSVNIVSNTVSLEGRWHPPNPTDGVGHGLMVLTAPPLGSTLRPYGINITGNVFPAGNFPIYSTGGGLANSCINGYLTNYEAIFADCFATSTFTNNVILSPDYNGTATWPAGNYVLPLGANPNVLP